MTPEWMDWEGWRWVAMAGALLQGFWMGHVVGASRERTKALRKRLDDLGRGPEA